MLKTLPFTQRPVIRRELTTLRFSLGSEMFELVPQPWRPKRWAPRHLALKASRACVHETHKAMMNWGSVLKGLGQGTPKPHSAKCKPPSTLPLAPCVCSWMPPRELVSVSWENAQEVGNGQWAKEKPRLVV